MRKKLLLAKQTLNEEASLGQTLSQEDLNFITGGAMLLGGSGTSSTSGEMCCDGTCVCKSPPPPTRPGKLNL